MTESANIIAATIARCFELYRDDFTAITQSASERFTERRWQAVQQASLDRIQLYRQRTTDIANELDSALPDLTEADWQQARRLFVKAVQGRSDAELAGTMFNTLYRKLHDAVGLDDTIAFVNEPLRSTQGEVSAHRFESSQGVRAVLDQLFRSTRFYQDFEDIDRDIGLIEQVMKERIPLVRHEPPLTIEILEPIFYRNKGAYLIGRMWIDDHLFPLAIPILNRAEGLYVDTVLWNENDLSTIFSFTRSYFFVDIQSPRPLVEYLHELLPRKKAWELYTSLGFYKHGKTEFYAEFLKHLEKSADSFVIAEGIKGMVMSVFTLPSYQTAFKVIKDKFSPTKKVTRQGVRDAYFLVKTHDRVGRMADTQEFSNLFLPRARFDPQLIEELLRVAKSSVTLTDQHVIVKHVYSERLMTPLNIYIQGLDDFELRLVLEDYGYAIKQLAAANIFPGDMLLKNFGVTRHGRVVFYDYDEICYLTDVNFREVPKSAHPEDGMSAEPWYGIDDADVFPSEFATFWFSSDKLSEIFSEYHGELFTASYWRKLQENVRDQRVIDVFPYRKNRRFGQTLQ